MNGSTPTDAHALTIIYRPKRGAPSRTRSDPGRILKKVSVSHRAQQKHIAAALQSPDTATFAVTSTVAVRPRYDRISPRSRTRRGHGPSASRAGIVTHPTGCRSATSPEWQRSRFHGVRSIMRGDDGASVDLAVVQQLVGLGGALQREVFDEHGDLSGLGEFDHFDEFGK